MVKQLDTWFGSILTYLLPTHKITTVFSHISCILIIRPGGIGDAVLLLPLLQQLSTIYPDAQIEVLAERRNAEVFSWSPVVSRIWLYDKPLNFLKLFQQRYDLIIDTEQWYRLSAVVGRLLQPSRLIGFATNERSRLLTDPCPYHQDEYEVSMFLKLLAPLGESLPEESVEVSRLFVLPKAGFLLSNPYVVIFPGASVAAKQWPAERFAEVARYCEKSGFEVVVLGGKDDEGAGQVVSCALNHAHNLVGKTSLTESAAIVAGAALYISGDSGLLHVAQLQGVPTVALFGPSNPQKWSRVGEKCRVVSAGTDCAPCSRFGTIPECMHNYKCMQCITVAMALAAVENLLPVNYRHTTAFG